MDSADRPENDNSLLTSIRDAYTLATTQDENVGEVDKLTVKNFLHTLAEVALSVASRKGGQQIDEAKEVDH